LHITEVEKINLPEREITTSQKKIAYDYLVLALGSTTNFLAVPGAVEHAFTLKSLTDARRLKKHLLSKFETADLITDSVRRKQMLRFVIVGGGATGVELAAEIADLFYGTVRQLYRDSPLLNDVSIVLIEQRQALLARMSPALGAASAKILNQKHIDVRFGLSVRQVSATAVELSSGEKLATETVIWVAGVKASEVALEGAVRKDATGRLVVEETLQLAGYSEVFAVGDVARFAVAEHNALLPATAQVAVRQAKIAARNITALVKGRRLKSFRYRHAGDLVSIGRWMAVADIRGLFFSGKFAWWLWRTVYLFKMLSWRKRLKVAVDWTWDLFMPRDISQI
jgi:NADH:ubiquinone reductase (H+-translocating)